MAQNYSPKLLNIASDASNQAKVILAAVESLVSDSQLLTSAGGNFVDPIFDSTALAYLNAYQANVFLQTVAPAINAWLDTHLNGDSGQPTYREYFQIMVSGAV